MQVFRRTVMARMPMRKINKIIIYKLFLTSKLLYFLAFDNNLFILYKDFISDGCTIVCYNSFAFSLFLQATIQIPSNK